MKLDDFYHKGFSDYCLHLYCYFQMIIKMKTIVRKALMIKIIKLRLRHLDNKHLKKAGGHIGRNVVEITIKMKTIV